MPLTIEAYQPHAHPPSPADITVGLINNMPDAAVEGTERQFSELLRAACAARTLRLRFSHLPQVPRGASTRDRLAAEYWPLERLLEEGLDALIVTGMEPGGGALTEEPYWPAFARLIRWAQAHTISSIWSCLAAHAAVLHLDAIQRRRLERKCFGVYAHELLRGHPLLAGLQAPLYTPHSRWNELPVAALRAAGYTILSGSATTGADAFTKEAGSLFVFFQGHPEYEETTLLKEYRRDVGRYARGEQADYPGMPPGYFSAAATALLDEFRARLLVTPTQETFASFPAESAALELRSPWRATAVQIYQSWLSFIAAAKNKLPEQTLQASIQ